MRPSALSPAAFTSVTKPIVTVSPTSIPITTGTTTTTVGTTFHFAAPTDHGDDDGLAGVREPVRR